MPPGTEAHVGHAEGAPGDRSAWHPTERVFRVRTALYEEPYGLPFEVGQCEPIRCVNEGMYDVDCDDRQNNTAGDDAACDGSPGAGDGFCDACPIMGGVTTGNEMFSPSIGYFVPR